MGYETVYLSLTELFPLIDARILKSVAIEHPKDVIKAASIVISEIVPRFCSNSADSSTQPVNKTSGNMQDDQEGVMQNCALTGSETDASSSGTSSIARDGGNETRSPITELTSDGSEDVDFDITGNQAETSTTTVVEDDVQHLVHPAGYSTITQKPSCFQFGFLSSDDVKETSSGSLAGEDSDAELSSSNLADETLEGSLAAENGDQEQGVAFSSIASRSTQGCNFDHLEHIIQVAKRNKRTLFTMMESVMNLMREVELEEKDAEKAKEDATRGGLDTLKKVEELRKILGHAKEGNDMEAGEVYGERSILTTEVRELENRLLNLSEERNKSLSVLEEIRGVLEIRLAAALETTYAIEQEKEEKEGSARKALAEQEAIMEKVVQESKLLQQKAEENSKLREFLMHRGRILDSLQGEIHVICQDIMLLKEKVDNRVPLSQSMSSSQTSFKLHSYGSSLLMVKKPFEPSYETSESSDDNNNKSPKASDDEVEGEDKHKEHIEDGWDFFDKETGSFLFRTKDI
ncbi:unnamed protein product [Cochlearia groenlandica]